MLGCEDVIDVAFDGASNLSRHNVDSEVFISFLMLGVQIGENFGWLKSKCRCKRNSKTNFESSVFGQQFGQSLQSVRKLLD